MSSWPLPPLPARFSDPEQNPFVGRRHEVASLEEVWAHVERGHRQAVFVGGEPGSGKTRLAAEAARALHRQGVAVLLGTTSRELSYPYQPLVEALDQLLLAAEPGKLSDFVDDTVSNLLRITPNLRRHGESLPDPSPAEYEYRRELFDAYATLLERMAAERPIALILEDLHWSSAPTRLLLGHLIESVDDVPLLILGTMRNTAPDRSDELGLVIADLYRLPGVTRIDLTGLEAADIEEYLALQGADDSRRLGPAAMLLKDHTGGNPLFLQELWSELSKRGGLTALKTGKLSPTQTVADTLERRMQILSKAASGVLELGAILGDDFEVSDVATAEDRSRGEILESLDEAVAYGLVSHEPELGTFSFRHTLIRHVILDRLSPSRATSMHARLAETVEDRYESRPQLAPLLARLFSGARSLGYENKVGFYNSEAARQAERGLAHEEAALFWHRAADNTSDLLKREEMLLCAAHSHLQAGDFQEARETYEKVYDSDDPRMLLKASIGFEDASWRPGLNGQRALDLLTSALDRIELDPDDPVYISALAALGRAHTFAGYLERARPINETALELARKSGNDSLIASALHSSLHRFWWTPGADEFATRAAAELREIGLRTRNYDLLGPAGTYASFAAYMNGDIDSWMSGWEDLNLAVTKTGQPFWEWVEGCFQHCHLFMKGDFEGAEAVAEEIRELGYSFGTDDTEGPYGIQMYMVRRETGQLEQARLLLTGDPEKDGSWVPGLLAIYTELGFDEPARRLLRILSETINDVYRDTAVWTALIVFLAEAAIHLRDTDTLSKVEPLLAEYQGLNLPMGQHVAVFGSADRFLAQIAAIQGRFDAADDHFTEALRLDTQTRSIVHQAETLARYSAFLRERGKPEDIERAVSYEERARALAKPRGHQRVLRMLPDQDGFEDLPDGLTPREVDVLQLLASGASNREIGEKLHISRNTAANHVRSILIKTGTPNRTAAAMYATDRGLLDQD